MNIPTALAQSFNMESPCHPPIRDDTKRFYIIYKVDILSPLLQNVFRDCMASREIDRLIFPQIQLMSKRSYHDFTAVRPRCNLQRTWRSCFSGAHCRDIACEPRTMSSICQWGIVLYIDCTMPGPWRRLEAPWLYFQYEDNSSSGGILNITLLRREVISLLKFVENRNSNGFCSRLHS